MFHICGVCLILPEERELPGVLSNILYCYGFYDVTCNTVLNIYCYNS